VGLGPVTMRTHYSPLPQYNNEWNKFKV
jgi:hypothetical protein